MDLKSFGFIVTKTIVHKRPLANNGEIERFGLFVRGARSESCTQFWEFNLDAPPSRSLGRLRRSLVASRSSESGTANTGVDIALASDSVTFPHGQNPKFGCQPRSLKRSINTVRSCRIRQWSTQFSREQLHEVICPCTRPGVALWPSAFDLQRELPMAYRCWSRGVMRLIEHDKFDPMCKCNAARFVGVLFVQFG